MGRAERAYLHDCPVEEFDALTRVENTDLGHARVFRDRNLAGFAFDDHITHARIILWYDAFVFTMLA